MAGPSIAPRQIVNGGFQDPFGNPLAGGTMTMRLNTDATANSPTGPQVCAGKIISVPLGATGSVVGAVEVWPNADLLPNNTVYKVVVFSASGQRAWASEQVIPVGGGAFDLNSWVA